MRIIVLNIMLSLVASSCVGQESNSVVHFQRHSYEAKDTVEVILIQNKFKNGVFEVQYRFKNPSSKQTYFLPKSQEENLSHIKLIDVKSFEVQGQTFEVYKFLQDDPTVEDDEFLYFYAENLGIVVKRSGSWKYQERLIKLGDGTQNQLILATFEQLKSDAVFFKNWR